MEKSFTKSIVVILILITNVLNVKTQDLTFNGFTSSWSSPQVLNSAAENQCNLSTVSGGTFSSSTGYISASASPSYFLVSLPNATSSVISRVDIEVLANNATAGKYGLCAFSSNNTTYTNGASFLLPVNTGSTSTYSYTAPTGAKYFQFGRTATNATLGGASNPSGGATVRCYSVKVWIASSCTSGTVYNVGGTTSILSGNSTNITLDGSTLGVNYQLYKGGVAEGLAIAGTGSAISWSVSPASTSTYTVKTVGNSTTCETIMTGNAIVTVTSNSPIINLTSAVGTNNQTPTVNNAITIITYSLYGGTATTAEVAWTGTANENTPPNGITVNFTYPTLTISGTPSSIGNYAFTATTDGSPAAQGTGTINVSRYTLNDYVSVASGNWSVLANWKQWNGSTLINASAIPNASTANVYIANGTEVNVETSARNVNNLTVEGTLTSSGSYASLMYLNIYGDLIVNTGGFIGDVNNTSGDGYDGISLSIYGSNSKITGNGGSIYLGRLRTNLAGQILTIDHDMTVIYYGSTNQGGHTVSIYPNGVDNTTITINPGKTLILTPWSVLGTSTSSNGAGAYNFTVNVNGTLDLKDLPAPNVQSPSTVRSMIYGGTSSGKTFTLNIGSTGIINVPQLYLNGTVSGGGTPTGSTSAVNIANGGVINVSQILDLRVASQTITGTGTINILAGCEVKVANTAGINGHLPNATVNSDAAAKYSFFGSAPQVSGSMFANANTVTVNNTAGLTISENSNIDNLTIATGAALNVAAGKQLTLGTAFANNGTIRLKSGPSGTATVLLPATITGTGAAIAEQYLATTRNWYISSPVNNAIAPAGYTYFQRDEIGASWTSKPFAEDSIFIRGKGYIALPNSVASELTFSGTLNTGNIPVYLTFAGASSKGFNLIGNPYPSHLTWTKTFVDANAALIEPSIYYRTTTGTLNNQTGWSFKTINASTNLASPAETTNTIPPMQAFWVKALATGTLTLNSSLTKSHNVTNPLKAPATKNMERQILRLQVNNGVTTDETVLYFDAAASDAYDRYDSPKFAEANTATQIFTTVGAEKLVINGMNSIPLNQEIGLGFVPGSATTFSLRANELANLPANVKVILKDNATFAETDLTDGMSAYEFTPATTSANRFSIIFRTAGVTTDVEKPTNNTVHVFINANNQIVINASEKSNYSIYNAVGQLIENGILNYKLQTINCKLTQGVYVIKVNNQSTRVIIK